jgi:hypothetical protein
MNDNDESTWQKAATAAGICPGLPVSDEMWLRAWEGYGKARIARFRGFVSKLTDVLSELRTALTGLTERMTRRKARLAEIDGLAALAIDHDIAPLRAFTARARRAEKAALAADEELLARLIVGLREMGIGQEETRP